MTKTNAKRLVCKHDFVFETKVKAAVHPVIYKGVCKKCGKQIAVTKEVYEISYKNKETE